MGRGTVAAGDGGGATTSRHCPSVSPAGCHLPMASPQGRINGKAETMIKLYGTPPTRALRAMWLLNELDLAHEVIPVDLGAGEQPPPTSPHLHPPPSLPVLVHADLVTTHTAPNTPS